MIPGRTTAHIEAEHMSRRELAEERGYAPHPDDNAPAPQWAAEKFGGAGFVREVRALRIVGEYTRCAHPHCRTSLTEETVTYCPHDLPFCEMCVWEDGCNECWDLSIDAGGAA